MTPPAPRMSPPSDSPTAPLLRTTALVGAAALGSRVLGLLRDMSIAWLLGSGPAADALVIALRLPHVLRRLFGEGALSMTLTADLMRGGGMAGVDPQELVRALQRRLALILSGAVLLGVLAARPLAALLAPGMAHDSDLMHEAAALLRLCLPYAFTAGMAALGMARLHSMGYFLLPALAPAIFNMVVLLFAAATALASAFGHTATPALAAWLLGCGVLCGGLAQWLLQLAGLRRATSRPTSPAPLPSPSRPVALPAAWASDALRRLPLGILGAAAPQLAMLGAMMAASWLPQGGVAALYYAERLMELPLGVAGAALGIAALPALAGLAAQQDYPNFARTAAQALRASLCLTLPAMTGLMAVSVPLVHTLFARGAFEQAAVQATALALCGYAPGLPAYGLTRPLLAAAHAAGQTRYAALSGLAAIGLALTTSLLLTAILPAPHALLGPALGVTLGLWGQTLLLFTGLNRRLAPLGVHLSLPLRSLVQQGAAATLTGMAAYGITHAMTSPGLALALAVPVGILVYTAALACCGNAELRYLYARWRGRSARPDATVANGHEADRHDADRHDANGHKPNGRDA